MPKLRWIEIQGFRAFGTETARLDLSSNLVIVCGPNSQGKTSLVEALEFLLTGGTVRREFLASAKAEFSDCLRNVYLPNATEVFVRAEIEDLSGTSHVVSRQLLVDYRAQDDCRSELVVDGAVVSNLEGVGLFLSEPPLRAPILMQHTLRYVVSARPTDRSTYFKALLEVDDLEEIRNVIADLQDDVLRSAATPLLDSLRRCNLIEGVGEIMQRIEGEEPQVRSLEMSLSESLRIVLASTGLANEELPPDFYDRISLLKQTLESRRESTFPITSLKPGTGANVEVTKPQVSDVRDFSEIARQVNIEVARLTQLFSAVLAVPDVAAANSPIDCPVCETENALTPLRVEAMRSQIAVSQGLRELTGKAERELANLEAWRSSLKDALGRVLPQCASWSDEKLQEQRRIIESILAANDVAAYDRLFPLLPQLQEKLTLANLSLDTLAHELTLATEAVREIREVPLESLKATLISAIQAWHELQGLIGQYRAASDAATGLIRSEIDRRTDLAKWQDLIVVSESPTELVEQLKDAKARAVVSTEIEQAVSEVDRAKGDVFDGKFLSLSDEIDRWWEKLRPDELVTFGGLQRRGTGNRFVDFKALLLSERSGTSVERDAAGVLSDSQLNCLGLSAFLARCVREHCPIVVLDDPVPVSDLEHRATFADYVVRELLAAGVQVIVTTYDEELNRLLQYYYAHVPPDSFSIEIVNPKSGASVWKTSDTLEALLVKAKPFLRNQNREIRKIAAHRTRDAAERLCKDIIVKNRNIAGIACSIADFGGKTLLELVQKTEPFLTKDASHSGKLHAVVRLLNPGSHDTVVPEATALGVAFGDLELLKRQYL